MGTNFYFKTGAILFGAAVSGLGIIHVVTGHFSYEIFPVSPTLAGGKFLAYLSGILMTIAGVLILTKKYSLQGGFLTAIIFAAFLLILHIPHLLMNLHNSGEWTAISETFMFFSGALMLCGSILIAGIHTHRGYTLFTVGKYIFALTLFDFGMEHWIFQPFVVSIIPGWIPWKIFWSYFVMTAFFAASISLFINKKVGLASRLLFLMFFLWVCVFHLPVVFENFDQDPAWKNLFVPIGVCGIALILAASALNNVKKMV